MKSMMVALDGSPSSQAGLQEAGRWAALLNAELRGVFVEDDQRFVNYPAGFSAEGGVPVAAALPDDQMAAENEKVRMEGEVIRTDFEAVLKTHGVKGRFLQTRGDINGILTVEAKASDLIILGRKGRSHPEKSREPGPTTETLIHNSLRPVLVVPEQPTGNRSVVFAYDGSRGAQRVIAPGTHLADLWGAKVSVITIGDDPALKAEQEDVLTRYWEPYGIVPHLHFSKREGKVSAMIADFARQRDAGMIVMGAFGHNPLHELFFGSTTLETVAQANCSILLMA